MVRASSSDGTHCRQWWATDLKNMSLAANAAVAVDRPWNHVACYTGVHDHSVQIVPQFR
jgi:hypothetical protein